MRAIQALAIAFLFVAGGAVHASPSLYPDHPKDAGLVNDFAGVMTTPQKVDLEHDLRDFEGTTKTELAVVTVTSLKGQDVDSYANGLFRAWGIGKKGANNGVLLLVSTGDRKVKIEVGYGLEPLLTDADSSVIIQDVIKPPYKSGDHAKAVIDGAHAIITKLTPGLKSEGSEIMKNAKPKTSHGGWILAVVALMAMLGLGFFIWATHRVTKDYHSDDDHDLYPDHLDPGPATPSHISVSNRHRESSDDGSGLLTGAMVGAAVASTRRDDEESRSSTFSSSDDDGPSSFSGGSDSGGFDMGGGDSGGGGASGDL